MLADGSFEVIFPRGYFSDDLAAEVATKGSLLVVVEFGDGRRYRVNFRDPASVTQELEADAGAGKPFVTWPNLVVVKDVTTATVRDAVAEMVARGHFDELTPGDSMVVDADGWTWPGLAE